MIEALWSQRTMLIGCVASAVIAFGFFVWPTKYRYDHMTLRDTVLPVRTNRITGKTEVLYPDGWRLTDARDSESHALPSDALSRIQTKYNLTNYGYLEAEAQNGSGWTLNNLTVNVTITDRAGNTVIRDRQYILSARNGTGAPGTSSRFFENVYLKLESGQQLVASLAGAEGTK